MTGTVPRKVTRHRYEKYRERASKQHGYVYFLQCAANTGWFKIGWTLKTSGERLAAVRAEFRNGFDWRMVGAICCYNPPRVEATLHRLLAHRRVTDKREWFELDEDETLAIGALFYVAPDAEAAPLARAYKEGYVEGRQDGRSEGYREGIPAGRHLQELDHLDKAERDTMSWDEQYSRETEGIDRAEQDRAAKVLRAIEDAGITLTYHPAEDRLHAHPAAAITYEIAEGIREYRSEIVEVLCPAKKAIA